MGWEMKDVGLSSITVRLSNHGGERERAHKLLSDGLEQRLNKAILEVIKDPQYAEILLFEPEYYEGMMDNG